MRGSRKFSKWESSFLVKLNVIHGQVMFYCTDNYILIYIYEPRCEKTGLRVPTRSDTSRAVQSQKMARGLQFRIQEVEGLNYLCSGNKGADQLRG